MCNLSNSNWRERMVIARHHAGNKANLKLTECSLHLPQSYIKQFDANIYYQTFTALKLDAKYIFKIVGNEQNV